MAVKRLTNLKIQYDDGNGLLASGYRLFFYAAGSSTKQNTYNSSTGLVANLNPIVLNSLGEAPGEIWLTAGQSYKVGFAIPGSDDPPASFVWTEDVIAGVNDTTTTIDQWIAGPAPTFIGATSFSLAGDQTSTFSVGRRLKTTNTSGTIYSTISASVFGAVTTVTVINDSGVLDSGLSAVSYGLISALNSSVFTKYTAASAACTGCLTTAVIWKLSLNGNQVTLSLPATTGTCTAAPSFSYGTAIPAAFRPAVDTSWVLGAMSDNGVTVAQPGMIQVVAATGVITVFKDPVNTNFTVASGGLFRPTGVSWTL